MGWTFINNITKQQLIDQELRSPNAWAEGVELLADRVVGDHYWAAVKDPNGVVSIFLALLEKDKLGWGYKCLCETVHPYHYDCPLSLLNMASEPAYNEYAREWRQKVREFHATTKLMIV